MFKPTSLALSEFVDNELAQKVNNTDPAIKQFIDEILKENKLLNERIIKNETKHQSTRNRLEAKIAELTRELNERPTNYIVIDRD